jgi:hypothetical protein
MDKLKPVPAEQSAALAQDNSRDKIFRDITIALLHVIGCGSSIRHISASLPTTALESDDVFCHELVLPEVADAVIRYANTAQSLLEELSIQLRENAQGRAA